MDDLVCGKFNHCIDRRHGSDAHVMPTRTSSRAPRSLHSPTYTLRHGEIDHGNCLSTRYGHLSVIDVAEEQNARTVALQ